MTNRNKNNLHSGNPIMKEEDAMLAVISSLIVIAIGVVAIKWGLAAVIAGIATIAGIIGVTKKNS